MIVWSGIVQSIYSVLILYNDEITGFLLLLFLQANHKWYIVVQVEIKNGRKTVIIRSPLQVENRMKFNGI